MHKYLFRDKRHSKSNWNDDESVGNNSNEEKEITRFKLLDKLDTTKSRQKGGHKSM